MHFTAGDDGSHDSRNPVQAFLQLVQFRRNEAQKNGSFDLMGNEGVNANF